MKKETIQSIHKKTEKEAIITTNKNNEYIITWDDLLNIIQIMIYKEKGWTTYYID